MADSELAVKLDLQDTKTDDKFKCINCSETYNVPIVLPCGHTI
jgi:hypothetical protein